MGRLPDWLRAGRPRRRDAGTVTVTITADVSKFMDAMKRASACAARIDQRLGRAADATIQFLKDMERIKAGAEARMLVRGGLDPAYATPEARDVEVQRIARLPFWGGDLAVAFLRGWTSTYERDVPREPYVLHQLWPRRGDGTAVQVSTTGAGEGDG